MIPTLTTPKLDVYSEYEYGLKPAVALVIPRASSFALVQPEHRQRSTRPS
jgi:hypothetical protein